jgi:putative ABC transport system ATP-binding protein
MTGKDWKNIYSGRKAGKPHSLHVLELHLYNILEKLLYFIHLIQYNICIHIFRNMEECNVSIILSARAVSKQYSSGNIVVHALMQTDLEIESGEIIVILGKSGSGKSTLLNVLGGLCKPDSGEVYVNGLSLYQLSEDNRAKTRGKEIGFVFQSYNLVPELNALDNIRLPFDIAGKAYNKEYENEIVQMLEIGERLSFYPDQLSGGERQRIAVARALTMKPALILADEPTGNLDAESGQHLMAFVKNTNRTLHQTYVIVTHDLEWVSMAHRVFHMKDGILHEEVQKSE